MRTHDRHLFHLASLPVWLWLLATGLFCSSASAAAEAAPEAADAPLFSDDFSSGDLSKHNAHFRWSRSGAIPAAGNGSGKIVEVAGPDGEPVKAMRFRYVGSDDGGSGDKAHWSEQRFHLTTSIDETRSERGQSDVAYPEVWIAYSMLVPANHVHDGRNNKGWLYLWKDGYEQWAEKHPDDETVTPTSASLHWWQAAGNTSKVTAVHSRERTAWGHKKPSFIAEDRLIPGQSESAGYTFTDDEKGTWVHYAFGARAASDAEAKDGFIRVYIDGDLALAWENSSGGSDRPERNGYDRGYLLGYHNSTYAQTTEYLLTDFRFGTTPQSVGIDTAEDTEPGQADQP